MKIKKLRKLGYHKVHYAALVNQESEGKDRDENQLIGNAFFWEGKPEPPKFWERISRKKFKEAFEICPHLKEDPNIKVQECNTDLVERIERLEKRIEELDDRFTPARDPDFTLSKEQAESFLVNPEDAEVTVIKKEPKKEKWGDFPIEGYYVNSDSNIEQWQLEEPRDQERNVWPTKQLAEASRALSQLTQWMRRPKYNGDWEPNWECDDGPKYIIEVIENNIDTNSYWITNKILSFKYEKIRDQFLEDHIELIEIAKPLL